MASVDQLQTFLQLHLANDVAAVLNLPTVLSALSAQSFDSSSSLAKWTNRVNALIHSREPGPRWTGIVLALHTSKLSRNVMMSSAQGWVSTVLPMLSRNESTVVWKAAVRLLAYTFTATADLAEFQRHVVTPNVPKLSSALVSLTEKQPDEELKVLCLDTLSVIVPLYPSLHRSLATALSTLSLNLLNGSSTPISSAVVKSASKLHACLHTTGGKVGGASLWRKSVDDTILFCSAAVNALRTTYVAEGRPSLPQADPLVSVPLNLDRLRCGVELLCNLLCAIVSRPVSVPMKALVNLCIELIKVAEKGVLPNDADPLVRTMEASSVAHILELGCCLTGYLSRCVQHKFAPYLTKILYVTAYQLEQTTQLSQRLPFVKLLSSLLKWCLPPSDPLIAGRIVKAILPQLASLLSQKTPAEEPIAPADIGGKKGKKRARGYEGDEVFRIGRAVLCESSSDGEMVLAALDALPYLLRIPDLPVYLQSISSRLLFSLLIALPKLPASSVSQDPVLKDEILVRVKRTCIELSGGSSGVLSKNLPLVVDAITDDDCLPSHAEAYSNGNTLLIDLMLHPRIPPLLRSLPSLDVLALTNIEESTDEQVTRESLNLRSANDVMNIDMIESNTIAPISTQQDIHLAPTSILEASTNTFTEALPSTILPTMPPKDSAAVSIQPAPTASTLAASSPAPSQIPPTHESVGAISNQKVNSTDVTGFPPRSIHSENQADVSMRPAPYSFQTQKERSRSPRPSESIRMIVDSEGEDDIEVPAINMESDTDSEAG
ncbi:hypothetical protein M0805_002449 [Coniferiporia weirii]|nr:hypothetical protein M0805_002449 [Coniferiporia weirii]